MKYKITLEGTMDEIKKLVQILSQSDNLPKIYKHNKTKQGLLWPEDPRRA